MEFNQAVILNEINQLYRVCAKKKQTLQIYFTGICLKYIQLQLSQSQIKAIHNLL